MEKGEGAWKGGLLDQKTKSESLLSYEGKRKGTKGLSHRGKVTRVVLGRGKKTLKV